MEKKILQIDECYLHYVEAQRCDKPENIIIFLHGFPENWRTWRKQIDHFSAHCRVIAPDLPGYGESSKPADLDFYQVPNLISVMQRFVEFVSNGEKVILVAHDWGGAIAWPLVAFHSALFKKLIILNAAHPSAFTREMVNNQQQRAKSAYIHDLIADTAEPSITKDGFSLLINMFNDPQGQCVLSPAELDEYLESWQRPDVLTGMLNYYRAMPQPVPKVYDDMPLPDLSNVKIPNIHIDVETLILWGEQDLAFVPQLLDGIESYVPNLTIMRFKLGTHWIHHQFSDAVNRKIDGFISTHL